MLADDPSAAAGDAYGWSVDIDGDRAVVGAYLNDGLAVDAGAAYVLEKQGGNWVQTARLDAAGQTFSVNDQFGYDVAISGDTIIVGAWFDDEQAADAGAAYVFTYDGSNWNFQQKLFASVPDVSDEFGQTVDIDGDYAVVGTRLDDDLGTNAGAAYVFERIGTTWQAPQKLTASDGGSDDHFGVDVGIDGNRVIVGARFYDATSGNQGAAYVFERNGGSWQQDGNPLLAPDASANDDFGDAVDINGDYAVIGARLEDPHGAESGSAYVFERTTGIWLFEDKLTDNDDGFSDAGAQDRFGERVAIDNDTIVVSGYLDDNFNGTDAGSATVFRRMAGGDWQKQQKLYPNDANGSDRFGSGLALDGDVAMLGGYRDDSFANDAGAVAVFEELNPSEDLQLLSARQTSGTELEVTYASFGVGTNFSLRVYQSDDSTLDGGDQQIGSQLHLLNGIETATFDLTNFQARDKYLIAILDEEDSINEGNEGNNQKAVIQTTAANFIEQLPLLLADDPSAAAGDAYGWSVDIDGDRAVVGAYLNDGLAVDAGAAYVLEKQGGNWVQTARLDAAGQTFSVNDQFGYDVAISGDTIIVGAWFDDEQAADAGAAYVFTYDGSNWNFQQKLFASVPDVSDEFGQTVDIDGDYAVVGTRLDDDLGTNAGAAYVFERIGTTWQAPQKLTASDGGSDDHFGVDVGIDGNRVIVGARFYDATSGNQGAAYVFERNGGSWQQDGNPLLAPDASANDDFGDAVDINGDYAVIGARLEDPHGAESGSAYVFERTTGIWLFEDKLTDNDDGFSDAGAQDRFGERVAIDNDTIVVSGYLDDNFNGTDAGSATVFRRMAGGDWQKQQKLYPNDANGSDRFGSGLALDGDVAMLGGYRDDSFANDAGAVAVFEELNPSEDLQLLSARQTSGTELEVTYASFGVGTNFSLRVYQSDDSTLDGGDQQIGSQLHLLNGIETATFDLTNFQARDKYLIAILDEEDSINEGNEGNNQKAVIQTTAANFIEQLPLLLADDPSAAAGDAYGWSVDIDGDRAVVGAYLNDGLAVDAGAAYVLEKQGGNWVQTARLDAAGQTFSVNDQFGYDVAISGDTIIVGAWFDDEQAADAGAAYVFTYDGSNWNFQQKLFASVPDVSDEFGQTVDIDGDYAVVGTRLDDDLGTNAGAAYVFERIGTTWQAPQKLTASDGGSDDHFGVDVGIDGNRVIVGARFYDATSGNQGAAYVFERNGGSWQQDGNPLLAPDASANDDFGDAVDINGDYAVIGARLEDPHGAESGSAYVFERTTGIWLFEDKLTDNDDGFSDAGAQDRFGERVAIDNDTIVVSGYLDDNFNGTDAGSATVFRRMAGGDWQKQQKLYPNDANGSDRFGSGLALDGDVAMLGGYRDDSFATDAGAVAVFEELNLQPGVTIITHGWQIQGIVGQQPPPDWPLEMATAILNQVGGGNLFVHDTRQSASTFGEWITVDQDPSIGTAWTNSNYGGDEIVLVYNWVWESNDGENGWIQAAADSLFASILDAPLGLGLDILNRPLHFIGHSRGAVLNSLTTNLLGNYFDNLRIDQVTSLDPHPIIADTISGVLYENDPDIFTYSNVRYADNYYRKFGNYQLENLSPFVDFDGVSVPGAKNVQLNNSVLVGTAEEFLDGGYVDGIFSRGEHSDAHLWYSATVSPLADVVENAIASLSEEESAGWWSADVGYSSSEEPASGRYDVGFARSRIGRDDRSALRVTAGQPILGPTSHVFNGDFSFGDFDNSDSLLSDEIPGWERHGGSVDADLTPDGRLRLGETLLINYQSVEHNHLYFPQNVASLSFDYEVTNPSIDDHLIVYVGSTPIATVNLDTVRVGSENIPLGSGYQGVVDTIRFELNGVGLLDSEIYIDNIDLVLSPADQDDADFNSNGIVEGLDFLVWQRGAGTIFGASKADGDASGDQDVDAEDLSIWETQYGSSPPPLTITNGPLSDSVSTPSLDIEAGTEVLPEYSSAPTPSDLDAQVNLASRARLLDIAMLLMQQEESEVVKEGSHKFLNEETVIDVISSLAPQFEATNSRHSLIEDQHEGIEILRQAEDSNLQWISEELLERVFG